MPVNPILGRLKQEDLHEPVLHSTFWVSLAYRMKQFQTHNTNNNKSIHKWSWTWVMQLSGR